MLFIKNIEASSASDEALAQSFRQSADLKTLGQLYSRYMDLVYGVCLKYLKDGEAAKDATLSVFEELATKLRQHEVTYFKGWLYQVAKNHCLMQLRKQKKFSIVPFDGQLMQSEETGHLNSELQNGEQLQQLHFCLAQLVAEQRQVLELFYLEGKCYNEIVKQTGIDWKGVRSFIQNGRRNLKLCMDKQASLSKV